jgi:mannose-1-phosphate guanylyltransferase
MLWAVIMAGGSGTRFWPESRKGRPKQFLKIFGKKTLLEQTADRIKKIIPSERILVVTQQSNVPLVRTLLKINPSHVLGEPVGRNTAPCAVLAASLAHLQDPGAVLAILPADHRIERENVYRQALKTAGEVAAKEGLPVTFGIKPAYAHTGFGYLEFGPVFKRGGEFPVYRLKRFCEKPDAARAKVFVKAGRYYWNSGMFIWRADALLETCRRHQPLIYRLAQKIIGGPFESQMKRRFRAMPNLSIDYGLMEKLSGKILAIPADFGWNDLGGWQVIPEMWSEDQDGNVALGRNILIDSRNNIVKSGKRLLALIGVRDFVIVDTEDALLVCHRKKTESVKQVVEALEKKKWKEFL